MPLLDVTALPQAEGVRERVLDALVAEVSRALGRPAESVWAVWRSLEPGAYAAGTSRPPSQPAGSHPPIVRVYARRSDEELARVVEAIERVVSREVGIEPFVIVERAP